MREDRAKLMRTLYGEHAAPLWRYTLSLVRDPARAEDVVQETLLRAWQRPRVLDQSTNSARAWLFTVARHLVVDEYRSARNRRELGTDTPPAQVSPDRSEEVLDSWLVDEAVARLSHDHRAVIVCAFYRGMSTHQIAAELYIPEGTVKSRMHYGMRALRATLDEGGEQMTETGDEGADRFSDWDGAYVLGALTPDERRDYEAHLAECPDCAITVADLAVLPSLLARVPEPQVADVQHELGADSAPLPESLWHTVESMTMPPQQLLTLVTDEGRRVSRRDRLRRVAIAVGSAIIAAAAAVAIAVPLVRSSSPPIPQTQVYGSRSMQLLVKAPVAADFTMINLGNGTTLIKMNCGYTDGASAPSVAAYRLVVTSDSGAEKQVSRWYVKPGVQEYHPSGTVDVAPTQIRTVAITDDTGHTLLVATV